MIVIGTSALVIFLTHHGTTGSAIRKRVSEATTVYAPTLIDYEIQSALLGLQHGGKLTEKQVTKAMADFTALPLDKHNTLALWDRVRSLHANLSAYDAQYVALAESLGVPLITCDWRIKRSGAAKCSVEVFGSS
ncbi:MULTISPECIES: type II toxin-antitoxin system VapC family toxin [unclassified Streptomyces]|uniref:Type II toxin-antitoxin system VapC family toxin n=1 Tax=Streptomyces sp. NBC_00180 TaxID=2903632 RepID=A0AAU1I9U0_9ACTN|nr:type II toxin-antitoxin system VapC family toxin [Streptomyces sp. NBC_01017]WSV34811.1 type II toxin-antitoxin system VapC family toxin [Streptomyces sp. NBC_01017]